MKQQTKIELYELANKISKDFNLKLITNESSENNKNLNPRLKLTFKQEFNEEKLNLYKFYNSGFEFFGIEHKLNNEETTDITYSTTDLKYFIKTFEPIYTENEFLKEVYDKFHEITKEDGGKLIKKIIQNNQKNLEDLIYYIAKKFKSEDNSVNDHIQNSYF